jgi:cytochrome P450 / NADPH-cytochrome P450 reductase
MAQFEKVPHPPRFPFLGNLPQLASQTPVQNFMKLAERYGPIVEMRTPHGDIFFISSHELVAEVCDDKNFDKCISRPIEMLKAIGGEGLFTTDTKNPNWQKSHKTLMPGFMHGAMKKYYPSMLEMSQQLVKHWNKKAGHESVDVTNDMTRLTFDTIGLCGFGYRFGSFDRENPHPFIGAMNRTLMESLHRVRRPDILNKMMIFTNRKFQEDTQLMRQVVEGVIERRKELGNEGREPDFLELMLNCPVSLPNTVIRDQVLTFLVAGHETTSGLLSLALYYLMKNPAILAKARDEVDSIIGGKIPEFEDLGQMKYLKRVLKETLRLWPTAPIFARKALTDTSLLGGTYELPAGKIVNVLLPSLHRDPRVWKDPMKFDPERFTPEAQRALPAHCYKPFGTGKRICTGKQFAMLESVLALTTILQHFEIQNDFDYSLSVVESLTLKPNNFRVNLKKRIHQPTLTPA